jgi:parvulin-like peptidyl-prolyl isomerase
VIILDTLIIGGLRFVLDKIAQAVDAELNDESTLREELLAAQMRLELGEIREDEYARLEQAIFERLRGLRAERGEATPGQGRMKVASVESAFDGEGDAR